MTFLNMVHTTQYESHYNQDCTKNGSEVLKKMSSCFFSSFFSNFFDFALRFIGRAAMLTHRTRWTGKIWAVIWSQRMTWTSLSIRFKKGRVICVLVDVDVDLLGWSVRPQWTLTGTGTAPGRLYHGLDVAFGRPRQRGWGGPGGDHLSSTPTGPTW